MVILFVHNNYTEIKLGNKRKLKPKQKKKHILKHQLNIPLYLFYSSNNGSSSAAFEQLLLHQNAGMFLQSIVYMIHLCEVSSLKA